MYKKTTALAIIAILALTACCATVVTTSQKAAAAQPSAAMTLTYKPGAKYVWTGAQCNVHEHGQSGAGAFELAVAPAGTALAVAWTPPGTSGQTSAQVGFLWRLNTGKAQWSDISSKQVSVKMRITYYIKADTALQTVASVSAGIGGGPSGVYVYDSVTPHSVPNTKMVTKTVTFAGRMGDLFEYHDSQFWASAYAQAHSVVVGSKELAYGQITIQAVEFTFQQ